MKNVGRVSLSLARLVRNKMKYFPFWINLGVKGPENRKVFSIPLITRKVEVSRLGQVARLTLLKDLKWPTKYANDSFLECAWSG